MPTWDNPDATSSGLPLMATTTPPANVDHPLDETHQEATLVPPGLLRAPASGVVEPLAHATHHQLELDAEESGHESEDEPTVEEQLELT